MIVTRGLGGVGLVVRGFGGLVGVALDVGDASERTSARGFGKETAALFGGGTIAVLDGVGVTVAVSGGSAVRVFGLRTRAPLTGVATEAAVGESTAVTVKDGTRVILTIGGQQ